MYHLIAGVKDFTLNLDEPVNEETQRILVALSNNRVTLCYEPHYVGVIEMVLKDAGIEGETVEIVD